MNKSPCCNISGLLVDYADGELTTAERQHVADHLAACADCWAELRLLERSLAAARAAWQEDALLAEKPAVLPMPVRARLHYRPLFAACGAAVLLVLVAAWWLPRWTSNGAIARQEATKSQTMSEKEIDAYISRETRVARLAASVQLLASQPGLESYKAQAERYLQEVSSGKGHGG